MREQDIHELVEVVKERHPRCSGYWAVVPMCHPDRGVAEWRDLPHVLHRSMFLM